ncbi:MAG: hypothetical protein E5299_01995 [Burkholderia gladioli]|nr:MAG: hypothetical protein E5299_01995 [Burkholderia gladioli]
MHKPNESCGGLRARVPGPASYQVRFQSNCLIFAKKMRKDIHKKGEPKARYRVRNWAAPIMKA